jgi:hypothetical protein
MRMERKYVRRRRVVALIALIAVIWGASELITPKQCKTDIAHMSQGCKELMYP